jgi:MFS family permease
MRPYVNPRPARIGALWFGIQTVWSALLGVYLQSRVSAVAPHHAIAAYAWIAAGGAALAGVVQVLAGLWSDRILATRAHRRAFYAAGVALAVPGIVGFFFASSLGWLAATWALIQLGMNVVSGPYQAAIPDALEPDRVGGAAAWMSGYSFAGSVCGLIVAATIGGAPAGPLLALILAVSAGVTLAHLRRVPPISVRIAPLKLSADMWTVLVSRGAINTGFYTLFGFLFFFVRQTLHVANARTTTGVLFIVFTIAGVAGAALAARPADRTDKRLVISIAAAGIAISVGAFAAAPNVVVASLAAAASGVAWGAFFTVDWAIAYAVLPRSSMATAMGVWNLAATIPQILAPAITAPLVAATNARRPGLGPRLALALVAVEFVAGAALLWRLKRAP